MQKVSFSDFLTRAMLIIFSLLLGLGVLLGTLGKPDSLSYTAELAAAGVLVFLFFRFFKAEKLRAIIESMNGTKLALLLALFCFAVNFAVVLRYRIEPTVDFKTFYDNAVKLRNWKPIDYLYLGLFPHIFGFSTYLSILMKYFGESVFMITVTNVCLTTMTGLMIFSLCRRSMGQYSAAAAFFLWSICPSKMLYNCMVLTEPLYTCLMFLFFLLVGAVNLSLSGRIGTWLFVIIALLCGVASGLSLTIINAVRPISAILLIAFFVWLLLLREKSERTRRSLFAWAVFVCAMLLCYRYCTDYWTQYETWRLREEPSGLPAYSIYVGLDPVSEGSFSEVDMDMLMNYRYDEENGSAVWAQEQMMERVKELLASGEVKPLSLFLKKLPKLHGSDEGGAFYASGQISRTEYLLWSAASNVFYYFCVVLCLCGVWRMIKERKHGVILLLPLYATGLTLAHMIVEVSGRYKYSAIPIIIILAAYCRSVESKTE